MLTAGKLPQSDRKLTDGIAVQRHWDTVYARAAAARPYGDSTTYRLGAAFIGELAVEDWGCGLGWYRRYAIGPYRGIDGSASPFADVVADLREYRSSTPALFMRHVLEHNHEWRKILDNAIASFQRRMVLVIFTPFGERTSIINDVEYTPGERIPDISFARAELTEYFQRISFTEQSLHTGTWYGAEHVFFLHRR